METFKRLMLWVLAGAILGVIAGTLGARMYVPWNNTAEMSQTTVCNLPVIIKQSMDTLVSWQLIGGGIGAFAGIAAGVTSAQRRKRQAAAQAAPKAPPAA